MEYQMKKKLITCFLTACMLISMAACSGSTKIMKPYTVMTSDKNVSAASMVPADAFQTFAQDIGVISVGESEEGVNSSAMGGIDTK
jgi:hypothetical protein